MTDEVDNTTDKAEDAEIQNETIDDLFKEPVKESKVAETEQKEETKAEAEETESEETETSQKEEAETTAAEEKSVPIKAYTEERRKRQEAERKAEELETKLKKAEPETKVPDPVEDPEGYKQYMEDSRHLDALKVKVSLSRDVMLDLKEDYAEKENVFVELARKNPFMIQQMNASPNPAKFAYQTAVDHLKAEQAPLEIEKANKRIAELEAENAQLKSGAKPVKKSALDVPDLTQATAAGKNSDKTVKETTMDEIMADAPLDKMSSYR